MKKDYAIFITTLQYMLVFTWCTKKVNVEATEIVYVMQKENTKILGRSLIIIDNYFGSQHN